MIINDNNDNKSELSVSFTDIDVGNHVKLYDNLSKQAFKNNVIGKKMHDLGLVKKMILLQIML
jgi:hypothetical protein